MHEATDSIVTKRLVRYLQYRRTYVRVLESFLKPNPGPLVAGLLTSLIDIQQAEMAAVSGYVRGQGIDTEDLPLKPRLLDHAAQHGERTSRLRFIHHGLSRSASWYRTQLMDEQMTADPALRQLLLDLGEMDAAGLWRTEGVMAILSISVEPRTKGEPKPSRPEPTAEGDRRPRRSGSRRRPAWKGGRNRPSPMSSQQGDQS